MKNPQYVRTIRHILHIDSGRRLQAIAPHHKEKIVTLCGAQINSDTAKLGPREAFEQPGVIGSLRQCSWCRQRL